MADKILIDGARRVAQSTIPTWNQVFQKSLDDSLAVTAQRQMRARQKKAAADAKVASYIDQLGTVDTAGLTGSQHAAVSNYLTEQKMLYANAASRIGKFDPTDAEYMNLRDAMNQVQMNFSNLAAGLTQFKNDKKEYLESFDNGMLSSGNSTGTFVEASKMYTDEGYMAIGKGGVVNFWNDDTDKYNEYSSIDKPFLKDFNAGNSILDMSESLYSSGQELTGARQNMIRQKLNNMISSGGRDTLLSLASDDFVIEGGLGLQDPTLFEKENEEALKTAVINGYMQMFTDAAAQGAIDNKKTLKGSGTESRKTLQQEMPVVQEAFKFAQLNKNVPANQREDKTRLLVQEINAIDPTKQGNYYSRGDFYNYYLQDTGKDHDAETIAEFKNTYGDGQIFLFNPKDPLRSMAVNVNTDDPQSLFNFYLKNSNLTDSAQNYHISQFGNYVTNASKPSTTTNNSETESTGTYDNL